MKRRAAKLTNAPLKPVLPVLPILPVLLALALPQAGLGLGTGETARHTTSISISSSVPAFHGRVKSSVKICKNHRRVQLFRKRAGKDPKLLGGDRSAGTGRWEVPVGTLKSGAYYAKVKPKSGAGCAGARSETAVID